MYLLDTNACIRILNNSSKNLIERLRRHDSSEIRLCSVVSGLRIEDWESPSPAVD
ncbi:MAG TPA: hypothetical protein VFR31_23290 [Thermoanaerobaculia bacterium]|nr:hypothetical protein [Thermoanaerobaculia bacterium]